MILMVFLLFWAHFLPIEGDPTVQCVQTGSGTIDPSIDHVARGWHWRRGSFTIGAKRYDSAYGGAMSSVWALPYTVKTSDLLLGQDCPYKWHPESIHEVQLCDEQDSRVKVKVNAVQQTDASGKKHTLAGWLHFEVELVDDKNDSIRMVFAQMYDEYFNAIGEFVKDPVEQCVASDPDKFVSPSVYQYLPCSAIGAREEKASQALYMIHSGDLVNKSLNGSKYLPKEEMKRGIHFTWRMNEYWCSRHERINPMFFILTSWNIKNWNEVTKGGTVADSPYWALRKRGPWKLLRKTLNYWLRPDWFGAADIKHPDRGPLQCNNSVFNGTGFNQQLSGEAPWIRDLTQHNVSHEYFFITRTNSQSPPSSVLTVYGAKTCQQNPYYIKEYASSPEFDGLKVNFTIHKNYTNDLYATREASCKKKCRAPETKKDVVDIANLPDPKRNGTETVIIDESHQNRSTDSVAKFWRGRKFMGFALFADVCDSDLVLIHVANSLGSFAIYYSSQTAIRPSISSWGHSEDAFATVHYILGWISHGIFTLLLVFGGVRGGTHGSAVAVRKMVVTAHSFVGFTQYLMNIFLVLISTWIPASPTADACGEDGFPAGFSTVAILTFSWVVLDIAFHSLLMFFTSLE
ncbi:hypothetical protein Ocin01_19759 [Orchesella cincta]|uniref:Ferric-chelate reductase 1 n=1 Tax=Orchesella cincta TaxID=48709 RepID=A0A1D2M1T2_ORCCI|nr:hypothetical protein Ocin01_19759 [Orchesella cincta]